jgi:hypothetical protein
MSIQMSIKVDAKPALKHLDAVARKQIPYATSLALNRSSENARDKFLGVLPQRITLRTSWWKARSRFGFNVQYSHKRTWPNLFTIIYTRAPWMALHETGGVKKPMKRALAVPTAQVRRTKTGRISKAQRPAGMKNTFIKEVNGKPVLFKRLKRGIVPMYVLTPSSRISPVLRFSRTISTEVTRSFPGEFSRAFEEARRDAK